MKIPGTQRKVLYITQHVSLNRLYPQTHATQTASSAMTPEATNLL